jgi:hypothetical protein
MNACRKRDDRWNAGILEGQTHREKTAILRFMSRNDPTGTYRQTDEERLLEVVRELTDYLEEDIARGLDDPDEDDLEVLYPKFCNMVAKKVVLFREEKGTRLLCCVPSFVLGLSMAGRVGPHYTHCPWFTSAHLLTTLGEIGGVSEFERGLCRCQCRCL